MPNYTRQISPAFNTPFNRKWILQDRTSLEELCKTLTDKTFWEDIGLMFNNASDLVNSLMWFPFDVRSFIGQYGFGVVILGNLISTNAIATAFPSFYSGTKKIATIKVPRYYKNFLDFEPYTRCQIYIPFLGFYDVPVAELYDNTIEVYLSVDFDTGEATVNLDAYGRTAKHTIATYSGKMGIQVPIGASNANEIAKQQLTNAVKITAGVAGAVVGAYTGNALVGVGSLVSTVKSSVDMIMSSQLRFNRGTQSGGANSIASPDSVFLIMTRQEPVFYIGSSEYTKYKKTKGVPVGKTKTLSTVYGFTIVENIHLENFDSATDTELKMIEDLLHKGVIF